MTDESLLPVGTQFGRYRLTGHIATGGMGEIYQARYINAAGVECQAVIKRLLPRLSRDSDFINYFQSEARISSVLNHPNVVQTLEMGTVGEDYYIAMEHIPGASLVRLLATGLSAGKPFSVPLVIHLASQIAGALSYIHNRTALDGRPFDIIHMDLAPHNMLVTTDGHLKVLDFGIARAPGLSKQRSRRDFRGRTAYLAPEQLQRKALDKRVDIFAMGIIMHEMIVGRPLFRTRDDHKTVNRILYSAIPRPRAKRPECPEMLERIIFKALQRDRKARYQEAREVQKDLDRCLVFHGIMKSQSGIREEISTLLEVIEIAERHGPSVEEDSIDMSTTKV